MKRVQAGAVFGRLTTAEVVGKDRSGSNMWRCICACGGTSIIRASNLNQGVTNSCGCVRIEKARIGLNERRGPSGRAQRRAA